jgi:hypothetical protein
MFSGNLLFPTVYSEPQKYCFQPHRLRVHDIHG